MKRWGRLGKEAEESRGRQLVRGWIECCRLEAGQGLFAGSQFSLI